MRDVNAARENLKIILTEWQDRTLPAAHRRHFDSSLLKTNEILTLIGARRAGKTWLCFQLIRELRKTIPGSNIIYVNLEDERLHPMTGEVLTLLWDVYRELVQVDSKHGIYIFLDEVQNAPRWSKWARRIAEQYPAVKLVLTGSSSKLLSREIATELRGRARSFSVYPFSFSEYIQTQDLVFTGERDLHGESRHAFKRAFNEYHRHGGFPATIGHSDANEMLKEYFRVMFYRDIVDRFRIKNIQLLEDFLTLLMDQVACHFSASATANKLGAFGHKLSKNTLGRFLDYAEDVFLTFQVKKYSPKISEQLRATRKIYAVDQGLVQAIRFMFSQDYGRLMENMVYMGLRRMGKTVFYHMDQRECDFMVCDGRHVQEAIQVCKSLSDPQTEARELAGLMEVITKHKLDRGLILTEDESGSKIISGKKIESLPTWYWLLHHGV